MTWTGIGCIASVSKPGPDPEALARRRHPGYLSRP